MAKVSVTSWVPFVQCAQQAITSGLGEWELPQARAGGGREPGERTKEDEEHRLLMENVIVRDSGTAETVPREHIGTKPRREGDVAAAHDGP
ncbi:hypothetical protein [Prauserella sp. PE36]|uniref:hypothetical protein n=1 Tax=Prauserella sp. PE36 TaxID=1504709 RepID=UPI0011BFCB4B|nr:hypothetical protein [Prauserella sp. PE36]